MRTLRYVLLLTFALTPLTLFAQGTTIEIIFPGDPAPTTPEIISVQHAGVTIEDGDTVDKAGIPYTTASWGFTFNWPHPVANQYALFALIRGTFGDIEGGTPQEGTNYVTNQQSWWIGTTTIQKSMGPGSYGSPNHVALLAHPSTTPGTYTALIAEMAQPGGIGVTNTLDFFANATGTAPLNYALLTFEYTDGSTPANTPPTLSYANTPGYADDDISQGVEPNKGTAGETAMVFRVIYTDAEDNPPVDLAVELQSDATTTINRIPMTLDAATSTPAYLNDGDHTNGEQYVIPAILPKANYDYHFTVSDGTETIRYPEAEELQFTTGYSNVAFLPGIKASRLYDARLNDIRVWEPNHPIDANEILLNSDGTSYYDDIFSKTTAHEGLIDESNPLVAGETLLKQNFYLSFIEDMHTLKNNGTINAWKALPYDWRLSFDDILGGGRVIGENIFYDRNYPTPTPYILEELNKLVESSANGEITIVAHSMGGLVLKKLLYGLEHASTTAPYARYPDLLEKIDTVILVASPQLGSPDAIAAMLHGVKENIPQQLGFFATKEQGRALSLNMQSAYNLLPSAEYFAHVVDEGADHTNVVEFDDSLALISGDSVFDMESFRTQYGDTISTASVHQDFLRGVDGRSNPPFDDLGHPTILRNTMLDTSVALHDEIDNWRSPDHDYDGVPDIRVVQIAGWGDGETVKGVKYVGKEVADGCVIADAGICLEYSTKWILDTQPLFTFDGDNRVVLPSAIAMGETDEASGVETYFVDLNEYNGLGEFQTNRDHASILEVASVRSLIKNVIFNNAHPAQDLKYITTTEADLPKDDVTYLRLAMHSPLDVHIYNDAGYHVGISASSTPEYTLYDEAIPNSYYLEFGEGKYLGVPISTTTGYTIELEGTGSGIFTFALTQEEGGVVTNTRTFTNIPVSTTTRGTLTLDTLSDITELTLDHDADGIPDVTVLTDETKSTVTFQTLIDTLTALPIKNTKEYVKKAQKAEKAANKGDYDDATAKLTKLATKILRFTDPKYPEHKHIPLPDALYIGALIDTLVEGMPVEEEEYEKKGKKHKKYGDGDDDDEKGKKHKDDDGDREDD